MSRYGAQGVSGWPKLPLGSGHLTFFYNDVFNKFIKYTPQSFTIKNRTKSWDERRHMKIISEANGDETLIVGGRDFNTFLTSTSGIKSSHRSILIVQDKDLFCPTNEEMNTIAAKDGFISGYLFDEECVAVQSTVSENILMIREFPTDILETIRSTPSRQGVHALEFDTRFNPGRKIMLGPTWLTAAWKMWFGRPFFELVSKERIMQFPYAAEIKELSEGCVFVKLFDKIEESYTPL